MKWEKSRKPKRIQAKKHAMLRWKVPHLSQSKNWPLTPDPSPQTSPVISNWDSDDDTVIMAGEDLIPSRPISMASPRDGNMSPSPKPRLSDVLANTAPPPYTLSAFTAFLSQNHCLETLEFTIAARRYQEKHDQTAALMAGMPMCSDSQEVIELQNDWKRMLDIYLSQGAPREINLPSEERDDLLNQPYSSKPPGPEVLEPAVKRMYDLMQESIFLPFLNQYSNTVPMHAFTAPHTNYEQIMDLTHATFDESHLRGTSSLRKKHSPSPSADFSAPRSPVLTYHRPLSSNLSNALHKPQRASQQVSHTSVGSSIRDSSTREGALTDDTGSLSSPGPSDLDPMTPPTTPPSSDLGVGLGVGPHSPKQRSDSGTWKKMGSRFAWPRKRSQGALRESRLPPPQEEGRI